jgi:hypothetical protein
MLFLRLPLKPARIVRETHSVTKSFKRYYSSLAAKPMSDPILRSEPLTDASSSDFRERV